MTDSSSGTLQSATLLLIEDNPGDVRLVEEALRETAVDTVLHVASDGDEALDFLNRRDDFATAPQPDLILLDWNVPRTSGEQLLSTIKDDSSLKHIPVIVLTGSQDETDITVSYRNHANACLKKTVEPDEFMEMMNGFAEFWLSTARLPSPSEDR